MSSARLPMRTGFPAASSLRSSGTSRNSPKLKARVFKRSSFRFLYDDLDQAINPQAAPSRKLGSRTSDGRPINDIAWGSDRVTRWRAPVAAVPPLFGPLVD